MEARNMLLQMAQQHPDVLMACDQTDWKIHHNIGVNIDQHKASALGVSLDDINTTLSTAWAGSYVNDFMDRGRVKKVYVMSDAAWRMMPDDLNNWYVRASNGKMVPFASLLMHSGFMAHRVLNVITVCHPRNSWATSTRAKFR
jgi:multidrug efflux pump